MGGGIARNTQQRASMVIRLRAPRLQLAQLPSRTEANRNDGKKNFTVCLIFGSRTRVGGREKARRVMLVKCVL